MQVRFLLVHVEHGSPWVDQFGAGGWEGGRGSKGRGTGEGRDPRGNSGDVWLSGQGLRREGTNVGEERF